MAQNEMTAKPVLPARVRSMEGLGVSRGTPDVFATVRSAVAVFEPCAAGLVFGDFKCRKSMHII